MAMSLEQANYCDNLKTGNIETANIECSALAWFDIIGTSGVRNLPDASRSIVLSHIETVDIMNRIMA